MQQSKAVVAQTRWRSPAVRWGTALALFGILERLWLWRIYQPVSYGDTGAYMRLARVLARFAINGYDGTRVPGYPGFLALVNMGPEAAWLGQMVLGWLLSMLLFWITWKTTAHPALGALVGGLYNLIPGLFLFEANLLSESLTAFWAILCFALYVLLDRMKRPLAGGAVAFTLGVAASALGMTRPLFFPATLWMVPFVFLAAEKTWRTRLGYLSVYVIGPLLIQGGWLFFIHDHYGMISPTTMGGYSLVQHTGEFFEYLPDEESTIRDVYIKYRDAQIAERGVQTNAIWEAIPELTEETGHSFFMLSREMQRLSIYLIRRHPGLYLRNVVEGWIWFWKAPVYWRPELMEGALGRGLLSAWAVAGRGFAIFSNACFLLLCLLVVVSRRFRHVTHVDRYAVFAGGFVLWTSIMQTLLDHGDNPRFLVPLQMFVVYVVLRSVYFAIVVRRQGVSE
jgi:hypothetical protein